MPLAQIRHGGARWTDQQNKMLMDMRDNNRPYEAIAEAIEKTALACRLRRHQILKKQRAEYNHPPRHHSDRGTCAHPMYHPIAPRPCDGGQDRMKQLADVAAHRQQHEQQQQQQQQQKQQQQQPLPNFEPILPTLPLVTKQQEQQNQQQPFSNFHPNPHLPTQPLTYSPGFYYRGRLVPTPVSVPEYQALAAPPRHNSIVAPESNNNGQQEAATTIVPEPASGIAKDDTKDSLRQDSVMSIQGMLN